MTDQDTTARRVASVLLGVPLCILCDNPTDGDPWGGQHYCPKCSHWQPCKTLLGAPQCRYCKGITDDKPSDGMECCQNCERWQPCRHGRGVDGRGEATPSAPAPSAYST